jgi:membrane-bound lytic murein transglycosylase D
MGALCKLEGSLPWETTLYVPKILAVAIVARNLSVFGYAESPLDAPVEADTVQVQAGMPLAAVASAAACAPKEIEALNPELRASRTPPPLTGERAVALYPVRVPAGKGLLCAQNLSKAHKDLPPLERYVVRFGETLDQICAARKISHAKLADLNHFAPGELVRGGTVLIVPKVPSSQSTSASAAPTSTVTDPLQKPVVVVTSDMFVYPDRQRVFYRIVAGDSLREIAASFKVTIDELRRWNEVDPGARLQEGMTLQIFAPNDAGLSDVVRMNEGDVTVLTVGTEDFFTYFEAQKGRKRISVSARAGDSLESIGKVYGVTVASMERINRRGRGETLREGDAVVVYTPAVSGDPKGIQMHEELANPLREVPTVFPSRPFSPSPFPEPLPSDP